VYKYSYLLNYFYVTQIFLTVDKILLNKIKQYLKTTLSVHTKFFHIVNTFTDHYRQLDAVMTRATLNGNLQRNSEYWLHFLSCSCKHNYIIYKNY